MKHQKITKLHILNSYNRFSGRFFALRCVHREMKPRFMAATNWTLLFACWPNREITSLTDNIWACQQSLNRRGATVRVTVSTALQNEWE